MITQFYCHECHEAVPLDHFAATRCGYIVHPDYARAVLATQEEQISDGYVRVSSSYQCPRAVLINHQEEVTVDPLAYNSMLTGTAWHRLMDHEEFNNHEIEVMGEIDGIRLKGHVDYRMQLDDELTLHDWKHQQDYQRKWLTEPKPEHIVQLSLYSELWWQTFKEKPLRGQLWYHFTSSPPFVTWQIDFWPLQKCLDHKPYGGDYTVEEILLMLNQRPDWREIPMVGETFKFGAKTGCDFCPVAGPCRTQWQGAPF